MRCQRCDATVEALHELAWSVVLAGQSDEQSGRVLQPPLVGELLRRRLAAHAIALIEAVRTSVGRDGNGHRLTCRYNPLEPHSNDGCDCDWVQP